MEPAGETGFQGRPLLHRTYGETTVRCENQSKRIRTHARRPAYDIEPRQSRSAALAAAA